MTDNLTKKYLEVQIDNRLNWEKHVQKTRTKASQALGPIKYSEGFQKLSILNVMYRDFVLPHQSYFCFVWGCYGDTT